MFFMEQPLWMRGLKLPAWSSFFAFCLGLIFFCSACFGHSWYVTPSECKEPMRSFQQRQGKTCDINFGLFWMCHRGHCKYSARVEYMIVGQFMYPDIAQSYEKFLTPVQVLEIVALVMVTIALVMFLVFLSAFQISPFFGFLAAGFQALSGILIIVACSLFGHKFRGVTDSLPFGWSFWLSIVAASIFIINAVFICIIGMAAFIKHMRHSGKSNRFTERFGFMKR